MSNDVFNLCPRCDSSKIEQIDYEIEDPYNEVEYIEDTDGRRCEDCGWEGSVG